jgi:hypothetical protein
MKKFSVLWLLPLAAVLFLAVPSGLFAWDEAQDAELARLEAEYADVAPKKQAKWKQLPKLEELRAEKKAYEEAKAVVDQDSVAAAIPVDPNAPGSEKDQIPANKIAIANADFIAQDLRKVRSVGQAEEMVPDWVLEPSKLDSLLENTGVFLRGNKVDKDGKPVLEPVLDKDGKPVLDKDGKPVLEPVKGEITNRNDVLIGIGSAKNLSDQQAIQMAEARARQDIAFQRQAQVKAEITDFGKNVDSETTRNKDTSISKVEATETHIVGQQSVSADVSKVKVAKRIKDNGTWWVVVTLDIAAPPAPVQMGETFFPYTESALDAVRLMDDHLEKAKLKPTAVGEAVSE